MRFVFAIVLFAVALASLGLGVAQRTILQGPDRLTASVTIEGSAPFVIIDGAVLNAHDGTQKVSVSGSGPVFMAYGRTDDVQAWLGDAPATVIGYDEQTAELTTNSQPGTETENPSPAGSDLWLQEFSEEDSLQRRIKVPAGISVLIASDGTAAAASALSITWPLDNSAPWSGPLIVGGIATLLVGLLVLIWALVHARRRHGPRRKAPKMPKPPKPSQLRPPRRRGAVTAAPTSTTRGRRRAFLALPVTLVGALMLSSCTASSLDTSTPSPGASEEALAEIEPPVVTDRQFTRIVAEVVEAVTAADEARDATAASERLAGPALELRTANYTARGNDGEVAAVAAFPTGTVELILPQQRHDWPRVVFATIPGDEGADYGAMLVQENPRSQYKVHYLMRLTQSIPEVAPVELGAARLAPDNKLLAYTPEQLAAEYGDLLIAGDESDYAEHFDAENDLLRTSFGAEYKAQRRAELSNAILEFTSTPGEEEPYAFATNDTGAIVAVDLRETEIVKPAEAGAAINPKGAVKALSGTQTTTKGMSAEYDMQILFYVPPLTAEDQRVRVLGFMQGLVAASEVA